MNKPLVMIIDDEDDFIDVLTMMLADEFNLQAFTDPKQAIANCANSEVKAILTDLNMPQMSGIDVVKAIRGINQQVPILLVTGMGRQDRDVQAALQAGGTDVLEKPIRDFNLIVEIVRKLMSL